MNITKVSIKNFLSISDVSIEPGKVTQIVGNNNAGKTTILKAIETAIRGTSDGSMVKHGEDQAEIIVEFDNDLSVRRRISSSGKQDVLVKKGDFKADAPQSLLNEIINPSAFNPLDLLDPKKRTEIILKSIDIKVTPEELKQAVGSCPVEVPPLDFQEHGLKVVDQAHKYFYQRRAEANKYAKEKQDRAKVLRDKLPPLPPASDIDESLLQSVIEKASKEIQTENQKVLLITERQKAVQATEAKITSKAAQIAQRLGDLQLLKSKIDQLQAAIESDQSQRKVLEQEKLEQEKRIDSEKVDQAIIDSANQKIQTALEQKSEIAKRKQLEAEAKIVEDAERQALEAKGFAEQIDKVVESLGKGFKKAIMSKAELPIQGLTYEDDQFFLDGFALENLSSSASIRLAVAIAKKVAAKTKIICIDGAEALDAETYAALRKEIDGDEYSYFVTKVGQPFVGMAEDKSVLMTEGKAVLQ